MVECGVGEGAQLVLVVRGAVPRGPGERRSRVVECWVGEGEGRCLGEVVAVLVRDSGGRFVRGSLATPPAALGCSHRSALAGGVYAALHVGLHDRPSTAPTSVKQPLELSAHCGLRRDLTFNVSLRPLRGDRARARDTLRRERQLIAATLEAAPASPSLARLVGDMDYELAQRPRRVGVATTRPRPSSSTQEYLMSEATAASPLTLEFEFEFPGLSPCSASPVPGN